MKIMKLTQIIVLLDMSTDTGIISFVHSFVHLFFHLFYLSYSEKCFPPKFLKNLLKMSVLELCFKKVFSLSDIYHKNRLWYTYVLVKFHLITTRYFVKNAITTYWGVSIPLRKRYV